MFFNNPRKSPPSIVPALEGSVPSAKIQGFLLGGHMTISSFGKSLSRAAIVPCILLVLSLGSLLPAQDAPYGSPDTSFEQAPRLSPGELVNLVAPIALYPDPLLGQVLAVSTYPQQLVEAAQWLQQNGNVGGGQLLYAARQQNWDPSVQALVAFPDVMALLTRNIGWTAALGQAFLAQPSNVMNAIQELRARARNNGQLVDTPQFSVNSEFQNGQSAIEIQPADPQMMYVPAYDPSSVWGPPVEGAYPALPYEGSGFGSLLASAVNLAGLFTGFPGLLGPSGWGWALGWLAHTLFINNSFLNNFGFRNAGTGGGGLTAWEHNTGRGFSPYRQNGGGWRAFGGSRPFSPAPSGAGFAPQRSFAGGGFQGNGWAGGSGNWRRFGTDTRSQVYHGRPQVYQAAGRSAQPAWAGNREPQASSRFATSASFAGSRSYQTPSSGWQSPRSNDRGFTSFGNNGTRWASRPVAPSSSFSETRMKSGHSFWPGHSSTSWKPPKSEHVRAPHLSAPHFKSHGGGHFSHGHSGGKSHHRL
jgi:hypothetical protein